ncbi:HD domain-containing protein [Pontibacter cellulosilyticus]|uniref:HD domain-containing protein n=1 Tax=Pontibacter cellulosilyticus TaxID=1720253 RepID=A0A923N3J6_9BACT|nr:HD domain-containing protein [Pontibacter cellulosilyticus]MBC5991593.1 HD domain-containing protein [Pontibacter cellulosilyticus]
MHSQKLLIQKTADHVKSLLSGEGSGHDWWHIYRVWKNAQSIAIEEPTANVHIVELAALLHDIGDHKFHNGDETVGPRMAREWLERHNILEADIQHICTIIQELCFKGAGTSSAMSSIEGRIVQDADRLDAIGAIGIARTFAYGGHKDRLLYDPEVKPVLHTSFEDYKASTAPTINHFYEKLLLLKDRMHTKAARRIAEQRHQYMETFLQQFYKEWEGN